MLTDSPPLVTDFLITQHEKLLLEKLYDMGILSSTSKLSNVEHGVTVSAMVHSPTPIIHARY